jgi:SPP1 family predicted phage head-tail adaptor
MTIRAGQLRHRITFQANEAPTTDDSNEPIADWNDIHASVPALVTEAQGVETWRGMKIEGINSHIVLLHWIEGITVEMRITYGSRILNITSAIDREGRHRELVLMCKELN